MALAAVVVGAFAFLFLGTLAEQAAAFLVGLPDAFAQLEGWIVSLGLPPAIQEDVLRLVQSMETAVADFDITALFQPILAGVVALLGSFFTLITLPFFLFFVLAGRPALGRQVREVAAAALARRRAHGDGHHARQLRDVRPGRGDRGGDPRAS